MQRPQRNPETAYRSIGDEGGLVVLPGRSEVKVLNPAGAIIYGLLDGQHTVDDIALAVVGEFDVSLNQARADVRAFIDQLREHGLLAANDGGEAQNE